MNTANRSKRFKQGRSDYEILECDHCRFSAVVFGEREGALCTGHALVYLTESVKACKTDKIDWMAVSDMVENYESQLLRAKNAKP